MVTQEMLIEADKKRYEDFKPHRQELEAAEAKFHQKAREIEAPFMAMLEQYYDEQLADKNEKPVKVGSIITNGKDKFKVKNRGMQFVFGEMLFNPRVICVKLHPRQTNFREGKVERHFHPSDLKSFEIEPVNVEP